nr:iron-containing alcohol dehydrogenase [Prosthecochloris sp. HL-130-GSB]
MHVTYQNPTQLMFGTGTLSRLGETVRAYGQKALLVTGGGSVRRTGSYDRAVDSLHAAGVELAECNGVEPNPGCRP